MNMRGRPFSLTEFIAASALLVMIMAAVVPLAIGSLRTYMSSRIRNDLEIKAQVARERLKQDIQFTSQREIAISPRTGAAVRGICFPVLRRTGTPTTAPVDALSGDIQWTELVFYPFVREQPRSIAADRPPLGRECPGRHVEPPDPAGRCADQRQAERRRHQNPVAPGGKLPAVRERSSL